MDPLDTIQFNATGTEAMHNTINIGAEVTATHSDAIISTAANTTISVAGDIIVEGRGGPGEA